MIDFDIFTIDGAKRFLCDALRIDGLEFGDIQLRFRSDEVGTYADVRERLRESLAPDDLLLHLRHVTANTDGCTSIRESGILGIGDVLSRPGALTRLFDDCGVHFDKASRTVSVDGRRFSLDLVYDAFLGRESSEPIDGLLYILAEDSLVNSFIHEPCIREYSTLSRYPEAIGALEEIVGYGNEAVWRWKDAARPYVVEFTATLRELELCRLRPDDEMGFLQGSGLKESVFNNLVYQALGVCVQGVHEIIASLPAGGRVPPSSIVRITPLDEFCGDPEAGLDSMCDREGRCRICDEDAVESLSAFLIANGYLGAGFSG